MGKHQYCQGMGLLHISRETVIHTILKIMGKVNYHSKGNAWENTNIPKPWVSYILRVNQYNFQNMGKVSYHSKEKYGKTQKF